MSWFAPPPDRKRAWPTPQEYNEALQNPVSSFEEAELRRGTAATDSLGIPKAITGNFATVYRVRTGTAVHAVRCFLRSVPDQQERYEAISRHLAKARLPQAVEFKFIERGIRVKGGWYPILKMDWVQGTTLAAYVEQNLQDRRALNQLADAFIQLLDDLKGRRIAHGDLQHGNLLVINDRRGPALKVIDYDGMWVPALQGRASNELGHPNYQHPGRTHKEYGESLDSFSAWVIVASLLAIRADPAIWTAVRARGADDRLLVGKTDFRDPASSTALRHLSQSRDATAKRAVERLLALCPPNEQVLGLTPPAQDDLRGGQSLRWLPDSLAPVVRAAATGQDWWRGQVATRRRPTSSKSHGLTCPRGPPCRHKSQPTGAMSAATPSRRDGSPNTSRSRATKRH